MRYARVVVAGVICYSTLFVPTWVEETHSTWVPHVASFAVFALALLVLAGTIFDAWGWMDDRE